jgi:hypothetical protein
MINNLLRRLSDWCHGYSDKDLKSVGEKMVALPYKPGAWILVTEKEMKAWADRGNEVCPTCTIFQKLVSPNYLCKKCAKHVQKKILLGL